MRLEALGHSIPSTGRDTERAIAGKTFDEPSGQNTAVDDGTLAACGQQAKEKKETHSAGQRRLDERNVAAATHGVLSAVEPTVGEHGGKQAKRERGRNLPEGHEGSFLAAAAGRPWDRVVLTLPLGDS